MEWGGRFGAGFAVVVDVGLGAGERYCSGIALRWGYVSMHSG